MQLQAHYIGGFCILSQTCSLIQVIFEGNSDIMISVFSQCSIPLRLWGAHLNQLSLAEDAISPHSVQNIIQYLWEYSTWGRYHRNAWFTYRHNDTYHPTCFWGFLSLPIEVEHCQPVCSRMSTATVVSFLDTTQWKGTLEVSFSKQL